MNTTSKKITKQEWSAALRSGEYKQCRGFYAENEGTPEETNCCLGVLGRLVNGEAYSGGVVIEDLLEQMGIPKTGVRLEAQLHPRAASFVIMNDEEMLSFEQIADYIDAN